MIHSTIVRTSLLLFFNLALLTLITLSCNEKEEIPDYWVNTPIASFSWTGNDYPAPVAVQFINSSENADQFEWDFDDGQTSSASDPQHTFQNNTIAPLNFNVVLKATDSKSGKFQRKSRVIVIQPRQ